MSTTATTIDPEHRRLRLVFQFPASITSVVDALRLVSLRRQPAPPRVGRSRARRRRRGPWLANALPLLLERIHGVLRER